VNNRIETGKYSSRQKKAEARKETRKRKKAPVSIPE